MVIETEKPQSKLAKASHKAEEKDTGAEGGFNVSRLFILRPVATTLLTIALLLSGIIAYRLLSISALPEVDYPTIQVVTQYPGASPDVMASTVTAPLETQFGQMPGLSQMNSVSSGGASVITLQFNLNLNLDVAEQEVQAAINAAGAYLPDDLPVPPTYNKVNPADTPIMTLAVTSDVLPLTQVEDLVDTKLAQKISQVSGVGLVSLGGGERPAVRMQANPTALAANGLSLDDLRTAITVANVNGAKGTFDGPTVSSAIDANDQIRSAEEYKNLIIAYRNGSAVRLQDVATVTDGAENKQLRAWMGQGQGVKPAIILNIQRQPGANVIKVIESVRQILPQIEATLPGSINVNVLTDRTTTIRASVADVELELCFSVLLVIAVIFVFLRSLRATIIPAVAVPLSLIGTFGIMYMAGFSINNLTLMALTIATGFVVDDAIVMIENISRYVEEGMNPLQAALIGAKQIGFTIISLTVSLIAVLIPLLFMGDVVGRLFHQFAITLAVAIVISAILSLTLTPMMSALLLRHIPKDQETNFARKSEEWFDWIIGRYDVALGWVLARQGLTLLVAVATLVLTAMLYVVVPKGFFPLQDTGEIQAITEAPQDVSFTSMAIRQEAIAALVLEDPAVASISSFIGVDSNNPTPNTGRLLIDLKPHGTRPAANIVMARLQSKLQHISGMTVYMQPVQDITIEDRVSRTQYQLTVGTPDGAALAEWVPKLLEKFKTLPQLTGVATDLQTSGRGVMLTIDRATASRLGVTVAAIDNVLYDAYGQRLISTIFSQSNQYRVVLEAAPGFTEQPLALNSLYVTSTGGQQVPLNSVVTVAEIETPLAVIRQGQFPAATISFNLAPGYALGTAVTAIEDAEKDMQVPEGMTIQFQGAANAFQSSLNNMLLLILAAIITVYIVLGVLYESYIHPLTILSTLPSAGIGALLALLLTGNDLGIIAIIGIILLIGIVKKNAIMVVDFALDAVRNQGKTPEEAIRQASLLRFRPIMMTTMAALLGALPLVFGTGVGSELRHPLGLTMVGGLLLSQLLTLFTTPVIYLCFERWGNRVKNWRSSRLATRPAKAAK